MKFPIMITLQEIRNNHPCKSGWEKVLSANGGTGADMNNPFELSTILESNDFADCMWALRCKPEYKNFFIKLAVVFADEVSHLMGDERSKNALDIAWKYSEGLVSWNTAAAARDAARATAAAAATAAAYAADDAARAADTAADAAAAAATAAAYAADDAARAADAAARAASAAARAADAAADAADAADAAARAAAAAARAAAADAAAARAAAADAAAAYYVHQTEILRNFLTTGEIVRKLQ